MQAALRKNTVRIQTGRGGAGLAGNATGPVKRTMGMQAVRLLLAALPGMAGSAQQPEHLRKRRAEERALWHWASVCRHAKQLCRSEVRAQRGSLLRVPVARAGEAAAW